jgi:sigma-B regulation protein RsbU (phosphoserine phosphatase)
MSDDSNKSGPILDVISPDRSRHTVPVSQNPFLIGRGEEFGNHLQLPDPRISRQAAAIVCEGDRCHLEDRGSRTGVFVNGNKIARHTLEDGDRITLGLKDCYEIVFRRADSEASLRGMLTKIGSMSAKEAPSAGLRELNLLLEATSLLHSGLPLDTALSTMLDHSIGITNADRGILLEGDSLETLRVRVARTSAKQNLAAEGLNPSQTALRKALEKKASVITEDLNLAEAALQSAQSIVAQSLRAVIAIPLYSVARAMASESSAPAASGRLLGALYLDSRRPTAFSQLDRQILDALASEAASILDNARLVERERQRQRIEQELTIARDIQQALIPHGFREFPYLKVEGIHTPCHAVGGDYFDVYPLSDDRTAILVADVPGKGLGAALVTTMLQGVLSAMRMGTDPTRVFNYLNEFLCEHDSVGRYATMCFGILNRNGVFEFINAGHPSPLILRGGEVLDLVTDGSLPVGLIPEATFTLKTATLEPGDTLALFSDGVTEAADIQEELYGVPRLKEVLAGRHETPLNEIQKIVFKSIQDFTRGADQSDDITLLLVRYMP